MTPYEIARAEIGVKEKPGVAHTRRIIEYHATTTLKATTDEVPWCSSFVNWCVSMAGLRGTNSAAARSWLDWGTTVDTPREGDIVILSRGNRPQSGHVGFYIEKIGDIIKVLGGNQSDSVKISNYPVANVLGYRRP